MSDFALIEAEVLTIEMERDFWGRAAMLTLYMS